MVKKLLYIAPHRPGRSPGQRFRFEQFMPFLESHGFDITYSYVINRRNDKILYKKGFYFNKALISLKASIIRLYDLLRCKNYDVILIYREAHFLGNAFFERHIAKKNVPVVYDFDDAIFLNDTSVANNNLSWLKKPQKTGKIASFANLVIVGNQYLKSYADMFNNNVIIIPTTISLQNYVCKNYNNNGKICIGWTGSSTTIKHFELIVPILQKIKAKYGNTVIFKVIVDIDYSNPELGIKSIKWERSSEIDDLNSIDIGIMPLPDDDWSKGKCGFKGIQYMALQKPVVMSPVGVNTEIVTDGLNGFLATTADEWIDKLSMLIESGELRQKLGKAGRETIEKTYSVEVQQQNLVNALLSVIK